MILWEDIDPVEAEARMRGLVRRLSELDAALTTAQHIRAQNPHSFSAELSLESLTRSMGRTGALIWRSIEERRS